jgi:ferric-dicitrate binding protein FerR (iron transport regulator)
VAAIERGLRARRRRRVMERGLVVTGVAAAASLALLVGGLTFLHPGAPGEVATGAGAHGLTVLSSPPAGGGAAGVMVGGGAAPVPLARGMALSRGLRLVAPRAGEVRIGAARGTNLTLEGGGEMAIGEDGAVQRYELRTGAVRAQVAKLVPGERFIVATADSEIEVHGTAFRVAVVPADPGCGGGTITRVSVSEGVVTVRRDGVEARVLPGQVWPERCVAALRPQAAAAASGAQEPASASTGTPSGPHRGGAHAGRAALGAGAIDDALDAEAMLAPDQPAFSRSELAAQNDLYAAAVRAKREGRGSEAIRIFERFGRQYPRSPLAESAAAQRMKLLGAIDLAAARRAAADYLRRYPSGFARAEAEGLIEIKTSGF